MAEIERLINALQGQQQAQTSALMQQMQVQMQEQSARHMESMRLQTETLAAAVAKLERGSGSLVDKTVVEKPTTLNSKIAEDLAAFKTWRFKFGNWISAALPAAQEQLEALEKNSAIEVTVAAYEQLVQTKPVAEQLSAQLRATLMSLCVEEPLKIVLNSP